MDLGTIVALLMGLALVASTAVVAYVGARGLLGNRSRFDGLLDRIATAQDAGVYPPSLRGDVSHAVDSGESATRAADRIRHTPARRHRRKRD